MLSTSIGKKRLVTNATKIVVRRPYIQKEKTLPNAFMKKTKAGVVKGKVRYFTVDVF